MEDNYVWGDIEEDEDDLDEFNEYENEDFYDEYQGCVDFLKLS